MCGSDALHRGLYGDIKASLSDQMLTKIDRMSMAASLEARPPLVDHRIVEFADQPTGFADQRRSSCSGRSRDSCCRLRSRIAARTDSTYPSAPGCGALSNRSPKAYFSPLTLRRGVFGSRRPSNASGIGIRPATRALESGCGCS